MAYSSPATVVTATTITSTWGNSVKAAADYLANPPQCRVYNNAAISIAVSGTAQILTFNSERYDTDTMHDTVTNNSRLTAKTAGVYSVSATAEFASNATGYRQMYFRVNGTNIIGYMSIPTGAGGGIGTGLALETKWKFAVNDYVEVLVAQLSGGALNVNSVASYTPEFGMSWIGLG